LGTLGLHYIKLTYNNLNYLYEKLETLAAALIIPLGLRKVKVKLP